MFCIIWIIVFIILDFLSGNPLHLACQPHPRCRGSEGRTCYRFFPLCEDSHDLCILRRGQHCNVDIRLDHCKLWSCDDWTRVQAFADKLGTQHKKKKKGKRQSNSSPFSELTIPFSVSYVGVFSLGKFFSHPRPSGHKSHFVSPSPLVCLMFRSSVLL